MKVVKHIKMIGEIKVADNTSAITLDKQVPESALKIHKALFKSHIDGTEEYPIYSVQVNGNWEYYIFDAALSKNITEDMLNRQGTLRSIIVNKTKQVYKLNNMYQEKVDAYLRLYAKYNEIRRHPFKHFCKMVFAKLKHRLHIYEKLEEEV